MVRVTGCPARYDDQLGYWIVDDPVLAREVLLDPQTFRPDNAVLAHTPLSVKALRVLSGVGFALPPTLANNAGESHRPIRAAVARFFSPARVAAAEPLTRELNAARVTAASKALADGHEVDLVQAIAAEPPALVVLHLLGLTNVDVPALKAWSLDSLELFWGWPDEDRQLELAHSAAEFYAWLRARTTAARKAPGDDLFGVLVGLGLTDEEVCAVGYFLLIAGQETTTQLISTAFQRYLDDPGTTVEQVLQEASSVPTWRRVTAHRTTLGTTDLPAGTPVLLGLTGHGGPADLAFGLGIHRCLGAGLARLETQVALDCARRLLTGVRLLEPPPMIDLLSFRAPKRLMVTSRPQAAGRH
ncbi:cytochrome P450 [Kribbella speibonae]|uniref:Cytochrome P450 n=1 Tax=Kribbella speibonae TaxID=1572660 RepID=A0ABY1ZZ14_9ACTN|nr:cytochrome P450 [Kribbella speibonae]